MADRAVLAGRVHRLQDDQQRVAAVSPTAARSPARAPRRCARARPAPAPSVVAARTGRTAARRPMRGRACPAARARRADATAPRAPCATSATRRLRLRFMRRLAGRALTAAILARLCAVAADRHVAPAARVVLGLVVEGPQALVIGADLEALPAALGRRVLDRREEHRERAVEARPATGSSTGVPVVIEGDPQLRRSRLRVQRSERGTAGGGAGGAVLEQAAQRFAHRPRALEVALLEALRARRSSRAGAATSAGRRGRPNSSVPASRSALLMNWRTSSSRPGAARSGSGVSASQASTSRNAAPRRSCCKSGSICPVYRDHANPQKTLAGYANLHYSCTG